MGTPLVRPFLLSLLFLCSFPALPSDAGKLPVFVSILPQKYFVERIGGEHVRVSVMVGPGQSPATYEPRPRQMAELVSARLFYRIGVAFEEVWMERISAANPGMELLDARDGLILREMEPAGGHHHDHDHPRQAKGHPDPHIWLSPVMVRAMAARLQDTLIRLDPSNQASYRANYQAFADDLEALTRETRNRLADLKQRSFMVFHPSWGYFADEFDLKQMPIESEGKEPGASTLVRLIEQARAEHISVIFVQQQFSQAPARGLAAAVGARLVAIDPLAEDYLDNLRRVTTALKDEES